MSDIRRHEALRSRIRLRRVQLRGSRVCPETLVVCRLGLNPVHNTPGLGEIQLGNKTPQCIQSALPCDGCGLCRGGLCGRRCGLWGKWRF